MLAGVSLIALLSAHEAPAQSAERRNFTIAAQPLTDALTLFGQQCGCQVTVDPAILAEQRSPGVSGTLTLPEALERLVAGTAVRFHFLNSNTVAFERSVVQAPEGGVTLPALQIQGQGGVEAANGPGSGYVAYESATGTKTDTPIIETPQSISVITRQQMDDQQPQTLNDALGYAPGVVSNSLGVASNFLASQSVLVRGFAADIYLDGLKNSVSGNDIIDPYLLNRIEVLSGPASVLYGQASPGGLVNAESKLPTDTPLHEVLLGFGSYSRYQGSWDFSGPIDQDGKFLYRLTGDAFSADTQTRFEKDQRIAVAPAFTWRPDSDTTLTILGKYNYSPATGAYAFVPAQGSVLPNPNGKIPTDFFLGDPNYNKNEQRQGSFGYQFDHKFSDSLSFHQNLRYDHVDNEYDQVYSSLLQAGTGGLGPTLSTLSRYAFANKYEVNTVALDNRAQAQFSTGPVQHDAILGIDYRHENETHIYGFNFGGVPPLDIFAPVYYQPIPAVDPANDTTMKYSLGQVGAYAQDLISYEHWRFLIGARADWAGSNQAYLPSSPTEQYNRALTWRTGLVYLFDNGLAPYVSYSTSFQPQVGSTLGGSPFLPTTGQQYEIGVKYQPTGSNSFISAAAYNLTEQHVLVTDPQDTDFQVQAGEIRARGIELQAHASLTDDLGLIATYTYTDAVNTKSTTTDTTIDGDVVSTQGKRPIAVPVNMASFWGDYSFHDDRLKGLGFSAGIRYVGSSYGDDVNSFKVPDSTLFDGAMHYDLGSLNPALGGLRLQINATNLFDKKYVASCSAETTCYYGLRRVVFGSIKYDW